ncbi:MAG: adenylyl-sulfate kinase, partial [Opitutaceae bacterium]
MTPPKGHVFWLCGLSGAGKSTLATALIASLRSGGMSVLALDGDSLRSGLC